MSRISTHILDVVMGRPAEGVAVHLDAREEDGWVSVGSGNTDKDGRCTDLLREARAGEYRLVFATGNYLAQMGRSSIYPEIVLHFRCNGLEHFHLPLLLSDNSYTTYRGS
jgi:5-hydroxyisourate hydrolase